MSKVRAITFIDDPIQADYHPTERQREELLAWGRSRGFIPPAPGYGRTHREGQHPGPAYIGARTEFVQCSIGECSRAGYEKEAAPYLAVMWSCADGVRMRPEYFTPWAKLGPAMWTAFGGLFGVAIGMVLGALSVVR